MSTRPATPQCSGVPRPVGPKNPVAWLSSTIDQRVVALGQVADRGERRHVAVHREHAVGHDQTRARLRGLGRARARGRPCPRARSAARWARQSRMPSMIEAWLSASEMTTSSSPSSVSNSPPLASKHEVYRIASSVPRKRAIAASSCLVDALGAADEPHARHAEAPAGEPVLRGRGSGADRRPGRGSCWRRSSGPRGRPPRSAPTEGSR